ncbi:ComEC/Rec2 family competence protein [Polaromonas sp.]|uniref:ComEC/Rec2 family competence protein n=1 Tax=Polaromonas sp. TaxID=1869339 RepID=UPI002FC7A567
MSSTLKAVQTRFRAYQLGQAGSSFSYLAGNHFTLIEAVITDVNQPRLLEELAACSKEKIDVLHITSWDQDHCSESGLEWILKNLAPLKIEHPGYVPHTTSAENCMRAITQYRQKWAAKQIAVNVQAIDPPYIRSLEPTAGPGYRDIFYHPRELRDNSNDNSTIKFFRGGSFNVLSLGDVEDRNIAAMLRRCKTLCREVDVMILAHHGADNGFTSKKLLEELKPQIAVCSSNYDNHFDHPRPEIRALLHDQEIKIFTTKTGDVMVRSIGGHTRDFRVTNYCSDTTKVSSQHDYKARKYRWLSMNADSLRNLLHPGFKGLK